MAAHCNMCALDDARRVTSWTATLDSWLPRLSTVIFRKGSMTTWLVGNECGGWAIFTGGGTHFSDGETPAGWCAIARSRLAPSLLVKCMWHLMEQASTPSTQSSFSGIGRIVSFLQFVRACSARLASCFFCDSVPLDPCSLGQISFLDSQANNTRCKLQFCVVLGPISEPAWWLPRMATHTKCSSTRSSSASGTNDEEHNMWNHFSWSMLPPSRWSVHRNHSY